MLIVLRQQLSKRIKGLKKYTHSVPKYINFHDIERKMEMLQEYAREIVNEIGKDGTRPISKNPDELVSSARLHRETVDVDQHSKM